jgi:hypothetical protein
MNLTLNDLQPFQYENLVRRGAKNDGGYLVPSNVNADLLISLGLGDSWKFELDLIKNNQVKKFFVFDHTVDLCTLIMRIFTRLNPRKFHIQALIYRFFVLINYLGYFSFSKKTHIRKKISRNGSKSDEKEINLIEIFDKFVESPSATVILKIDIEGSEYEIIEQILNLNKQILLVVIEFHDIHKQSEKFLNYLNQLKSKYVLIHSHWNNYSKIDANYIPDAVEFTFIKQELFHGNKKIDSLPLPRLDSPSTPMRPDYSIKFLNY